MLRGVATSLLPNRPSEKQIIRILCQQINSQNKSLLHLPPELLQIIFEFAVEHNQRGFKCATTISHVSQKIRRIAISTCRLWSYIRCSMAKSESSIIEFWDRTLDRVKNIPVDIIIQKIAEPKACHLAVCRLDKISSINSLSLESPNSMSIAELRSPSFALPINALYHLSFRVDSNAHDGWDETLLARFPQITRLSLCGVRGSHNNRTSFKSIQELILDDISMDLVSILASLPNLTFLEVGQVGWCENAMNSVVLPNLVTLKALIANSWIYQLRCPKITTFVVDSLRSGPTYSDDVLHWISAHPSITRLECRLIDDYHMLANVCPQLEHLVIRGHIDCFHSDQIRTPRFPALKSFGFHDLVGLVTVELFEQLVCSMCLPASHPRSKLAMGERHLERLDLLFCSKKKSVWRRLNGTLYQEAKQTSRMLQMEEIKRLGSMYIGDEWLEMSFSWI
jgi:hypothetical protein